MKHHCALLAVAPAALLLPVPHAHSSAQQGQDAYTAYCSGCHQFDGQGIPGVYPALAGSPIVKGDARALARLILDGGFANTTMPKFREVLDDETTAAILTYIRTSWSNEASPVAPSEIPAPTGE